MFFVFRFHAGESLENGAGTFTMVGRLSGESGVYAGVEAGIGVGTGGGGGAAIAPIFPGGGLDSFVAPHAAITMTMTETARLSLDNWGPPNRPTLHRGLVYF